MQRQKITEEMVNDIIDKYSYGETITAIANKYRVATKTITKILKNKNIKIRTSSEIKRKCNNESIFETIDSQEKAYWIGFIAADGNMSKNGQLTLQLAEKDLHHLEKFHKFMGATSKISKIECKLNGKSFLANRVSFKSKKLKEDLARHNIIKAKSKILTLSENIPKQFMSSYILGLVDGDGSFFLSSDRQKPKLNFSLISSLAACEQVMRIFVEMANVNAVSLANSTCSDVVYLKYCGNNNIYKIAKFLYSNNPEIFLERKKQIILENLPQKYPRDF